MPRNLTIFALVLVLLIPLAPTTAQDNADDLTEDQLVLLNEVIAAYGNFIIWDTYSLTQQNQISTATTTTGEDTFSWTTETLLLATDATINRTEESVTATIRLQQNRVTSDAEGENADDLLEVIIDPSTVQVRGADENAFVNVTNDVADYVIFGVPDLIDLTQPTDRTSWLENATTDIFDLGVTETETGVRVQAYELILDFGSSLSFIEFDLDSFLRPFNGLVEIGTLVDAVMNDTELTLQVRTDQTTGQLLSTRLFINIAVEVEGAAVVNVEDGSGIFQLEYGRQIDTVYINAAPAAGEEADAIEVEADATEEPTLDSSVDAEATAEATASPDGD